MSKSKIKVPEGIHEATLVSIRSGGDPLTVVLTFELHKPDERHEKFYILHSQFKVYTMLAAKNIHHAGNKAAKLFGDNWDVLAKRCPNSNSYKYLSMKDFKVQTKEML